MRTVRWLPVCPCVVSSYGQILHTQHGGMHAPPSGTHHSPTRRAGQERTWVSSFLTARIYLLNSFHTQLTTTPESQQRQEDSERSPNSPATSRVTCRGCQSMRVSHLQFDNRVSSSCRVHKKRMVWTDRGKSAARSVFLIRWCMGPGVCCMEYATGLWTREP